MDSCSKLLVLGRKKDFYGVGLTKILFLHTRTGMGGNFTPIDISCCINFVKLCFGRFVKHPFLRLLTKNYVKILTESQVITETIKLVQNRFYLKRVCFLHVVQIREIYF